METEKVSAVIAALGLDCKVELVELGAKDLDGGKPWEHDRWLVTFSRGRAAETFTFRTGTGSRQKGARAGSWEKLGAERERSGSREIVAQHGRAIVDLFWMRPIAPTPENVMECLRSDASAIEQTFEDWCSDFGYDTDSRKVEARYQACRENGTKLIKLVGLSGLERLRNAEEG